jgi:hypothetical protein
LKYPSLKAVAQIGKLYRSECKSPLSPVKQFRFVNKLSGGIIYADYSKWKEL